jgi:hypothetical protein
VWGSSTATGATPSIRWNGDAAGGQVVLEETGAGDTCDATTHYCDPAVALGGPIASASGDFDVTFTAAGFSAAQDGDTVALVLIDGPTTAPGQSDWARASFTWSPGGQGNAQLQAAVSHGGSMTQGTPQVVPSGNVSDGLTFRAVRQSGALTISVTYGATTATQQGTLLTTRQPFAMLGIYSTTASGSPDSGIVAAPYVTLDSISITGDTASGTLHSDSFTCDDLGSLETH